MTGACALFYSRRSRFGRGTADLGLDSSSDQNLSSGNNHHQPSRTSRRHHHRNNSEACDTSRRYPNVRHLSLSERESFRLDQSTSQSQLDNSINTETLSSNTSGLRFTRNDRLPGAVLLARERLVERLRGVSISLNRSNSRASSGIYHDEITDTDDFRLVNAREWVTESSRDRLIEAAPFVNLYSQTGPSKKKPPGLHKEALSHLRLEIFNGIENGDTLVQSRSSQECTICLESFIMGDKLIHLPCGHEFHYACLNPWIQTCGDCPNCRTYVVIDFHRETEGI